MPMGVGATVDYIFYSAEPTENRNKGGECGNMGPLKRREGTACYSRMECLMVSLPCQEWGSG